MRVTPIEILNKEFDKRFRGYDEDQVSHYLDTVATELDQILKENSELKQQLEATKDKLKYFEQLQDSLNNSIIVAHEAADRLKQNARKEAELILYEAEQEASRLVAESTAQAQQITANNDNLRRSGQELHKQLRYLLTSQLDALDNMRNSDLLQPLEFKFSAAAISSAPEAVQLPEQGTVELVAEPEAEVESVTFLEAEENEEKLTPESAKESTPEFVSDDDKADEEELEFMMRTTEIDVITPDAIPDKKSEASKPKEAKTAKKASKKGKKSKTNMPSYDTEERYIPVPRLEEFDTGDFSALLNEAFEKEQAAAGANNLNSVRGKTIQIDLPK